MIFNGIKLLIDPVGAWSSDIKGRRHSAVWLLGASLTAVVFPATAVVAGHIGSALLGHVDHDMAIQRAALGLVATVGGGLVMAPALTLAMIRISGAARAQAESSVAGPVAMGLLWPTRAAGLVLLAPPLLGLGPELGEVAWLVLATVIVFRTVKLGAVKGLGVRRRWAVRFLWQNVLVFMLLFVAIPVGPAMLLRAMMGVAGVTVHAPPEPIVWPLPQQPNW